METCLYLRQVGLPVAIQGNREANSATYLDANSKDALFASTLAVGVAASRIVGGSDCALWGVDRPMVRLDPDALALAMHLVPVPIVGLVRRFRGSFLVFPFLVLAGLRTRQIAR
ncbi:hypothetical protein A9K66_00435 [Mesorhizobium sp. AA23]|nr:hypothetical protein A9K66_00435 [Mesorhizobium sp. AA23]